MSRLWTAKDVAEFLAVTPGWVYAEVRANRIPHIRLGRYVRFNPESIEAWAAEREQGPVVTLGQAPRKSTAEMQGNHGRSTNGDTKDASGWTSGQKGPRIGRWEKEAR
jgi:excisionase family DNA binding protein